MKRVHIIFLLTLMLISAACTNTENMAAQTAAPAPVEHRGAMRAMFSDGDISGKIPVAELTGKPNAYAVAPLEDLRGEITVVDGKVFVSRVENGAPVKADEANAKAIFAVWSNVARWQETEVPASVKTYKELESFIAKTAAEKKFAAGQAFPFLLKGKFANVAAHINDYRADGEKVTREKHDAAKFRLNYAGETLEMVGFYSEKHQGVFVHHTNSSHVHATTADGITTHVDDLTLDAGVKLFLPQQ